jgi:hypothetical protein
LKSTLDAAYRRAAVILTTKTGRSYSKRYLAQQREKTDAATLTSDELAMWRHLFEELRSLPGEHRYGVTLRDGPGLWLTLWVRRSTEGRIPCPDPAPRQQLGPSHKVITSTARPSGEQVRNVRPRLSVLRNSIYRGPFNNLLHELANFPTFRALIGTKHPRRRMVDEEAILRFFAMRAGIGDYRTPLKKFLNEFMARVRIANVDQIAEYKRVFYYAIQRAATLLGNSSFRLLDLEGEPEEPAVNRALLEAQLLACSWIAPASEPNPQLAKRNVAALFRPRTHKTGSMSASPRKRPKWCVAAK